MQRKPVGCLTIPWDEYYHIDGERRKRVAYLVAKQSTNEYG